jgi:hypothetical protein
MLTSVSGPKDKPSKQQAEASGCCFLGAWHILFGPNYREVLLLKHLPTLMSSHPRRQFSLFIASYWSYQDAVDKQVCLLPPSVTCQEAVDKQAWSLLATRSSNLHFLEVHTCNMLWQWTAPSVICFSAYTRSHVEPCVGAFKLAHTTWPESVLKVLLAFKLPPHKPCMESDWVNEQFSDSD